MLDQHARRLAGAAVEPVATPADVPPFKAQIGAPDVQPADLADLDAQLSGPAGESAGQARCPTDPQGASLARMAGVVLE